MHLVILVVVTIGIGTLISTQASAQESVRYGYDALGRVVWAEYGNGQTTRYDYDPAGNWLVTQTATGSGGYAPIAEPDDAETPRNLAVNIYVRSNDFEATGQPFTVTSVTTPSAGSVSIAPGGTHVIYAPPGSVGYQGFTYTITNSDGLTDTTSVSVRVKHGAGYCSRFPDDPWC